MSRRELRVAKHMRTILVGLLLTVTTFYAFSRNPVEIITDREVKLDDLSMDELVRRSIEIDRPSFINRKNFRCGYALSPSVWRMDVAHAESQNDAVKCKIPKDKYILVSVASSAHIEMNPGGDVCDDLRKNSKEDIDSLMGFDLRIDGDQVKDLEKYRRSESWCPTPTIAKGNFLAGHRSVSDGYYVFFKLKNKPDHVITLSVISPCWLDLRDRQTGECPPEPSKRTVTIYFSNE